MISFQIDSLHMFAHVFVSKGLVREETPTWEPTFPSFLGVTTHMFRALNLHFSMRFWGPKVTIIPKNPPTPPDRIGFFGFQSHPKRLEFDRCFIPFQSPGHYILNPPENAWLCC